MDADSDLRKAVMEQLTVPVEVAGKVFGLCRVSAYEAVKDGTIPSIRIGRRIAVPTAALRKMLGIEAA